MEVSVVIPCYNEARTIGNQLAALSRQECPDPWEVIVADNGSRDRSVEIVESYKTQLPQLRLVDASDRAGGGHARNVGVSASRGKSIVFCDADDEVGSGWLAAARRALQKHDFIACRLDFRKLNPPEIFTTVNNPQAHSLQRVDYPPYLPHASGCSLGVKRTIHDAIGGFDESLPRLMDTDYCFRLQLLGVRLQFVPDAVVHYRFAHSPGKLYRQARLWAQYNVLMYKRYRQNLRLANPWRRHLARWRGLVRCAPRVLNKETRPAWTKALGTQVGLLQGSIKYGVPPIAAVLLNSPSLFSICAI
jgi:glycosyltransferase involved in cell wall biosynthesis